MAEDSSIEVIPEGQPLARANEVLPNVIHILPVAARPFFPGQGVPLVMDAEHWQGTLSAIHEAGNHIVGLLLTRGDEAARTTRCRYSSSACSASRSSVC
jgi:ATP-dependent Lon protease